MSIKRSRTKPRDVQRVPGMPNALKIYRIDASPFWQVRLFVDGRLKRESTKCVDRRDAIAYAKKFFDDIRIARRLDVNVHQDTFHACARRLLASQKGLITRGERDVRINKEDEKKLNKDILPFFGTKAVASITKSIIQDYIDQLTANRRLTPSTISKHLVVIRKVLKEAQGQDLLKFMPLFPTTKRKDTPRPYFTDTEYKLLRDIAKRLATENLTVRYVPLTQEIYDLIIFATNVFVRLSDIKLLKHKHVEVIKETGTKGKKGDRYVAIMPPKSKTAERESISMPVAVPVYERVKDRHEKAGLASEEDYVFLPEFKNRDYALATMRRQFEFVLEQAGLRLDKLGRTRTLYSLRHTAIMFRLLKGDVDIHTLAHNALTSVDQIERFYGSHFKSRMKVKQLQSFKKRKS